MMMLVFDNFGLNILTSFVLTLHINFRKGSSGDFNEVVFALDDSLAIHVSLKEIVMNYEDVK